MVDILHSVGIQGATPERVYEALSTIEGLADWWTTDTTGEAGTPGGVIQFRFPPGGFDMEVVRLDRSASTTTTRSSRSAMKAGARRCRSCTTAAPSGPRS